MRRATTRSRTIGGIRTAPETRTTVGRRRSALRTGNSQARRATPVVPLSRRIISINVARTESLTLLGITHAETVEMMFPNWLNNAFVGNDPDIAYRPYNLNLPASMLRRPRAHYQVDSPITEHGKVCAALTGRGILLAKYQPTAIFTSPELRCVETAHSIQRALHINDCKLCVEPSLAEYARYRDYAQMCWLTDKQLQDKGINICKTYIQLLTVERLPKNETPQEFVERIQRFYEYIIANFEEQCAVIVGNITGIFVLADGIATIPWHLQAPHAYMSSCHVHAVEVKPDARIEPIKDPIMPLTRTAFDAELQQKIENSK